MSHGNSRRRLFAKFVGRFFGTVEENPGIEVAYDLGVPIILHGGTVFELELTGQFNLLEGVEVRVENCDTNLTLKNHEFDGDTIADQATQLLIENGITAHRCLDIEHLVRELIACGDIGEVFPETLLLPHIRRWLADHHNSARSVHLCDFLSTKQGHLPCGEGNLPLAEIARLFRQLDTERNSKNLSIPLLDLVAEPASKDWQTLLSYLAKGRVGYGWALHNAMSFTTLLS
jgi:sugar phosphate isomerase/epimerase